MKKHLLFIATFIATLFPFWAANAQTSVSVTPVSANYTAATPTVTFEVKWPAGSRNANERAKVWLFVDYRRVQNNAYAGGWLRAGITDPPVLCTAGTPTLAPGNDKGFWLQGPADNSAFAATVTVQVNVDVTGYDPKFGWCAYATDLPPYAEAIPGGYSLRGTEPFIIQTIPGDAGSTVTQSATTFHGCMYGLTDATGCPGELPPMPAITGFSASAATLCAGQSATLTATAAGAELDSFDDGATWQPGATKAVTPTATTTCILKATRNAGGCTVT
ncbi:MAG: hypothetical protein LBN98_05550, partial [Prevotellaceae bacterium]|nr:hypothetical protein [Prevotellaceae bacterium]